MTFKKAVQISTLMIVFGVCIAGAAMADPADEYKKLPGYVDFDEMNIFGDVESTVEVFLRGPLLDLVREAVKHEEPELAGIIAEIKFVRVQVFPIERDLTEDVRAKTNALAKKLEKKGWEIAVRVRERKEQVHVYLLPGKKGDIEGLVVMVVEDDEEAAFINIVGNIDPAQIGRIGRTFDIHALDDLPIEVKEKIEKEKRRTNRR